MKTAKIAQKQPLWKLYLKEEYRRQEAESPVRLQAAQQHSTYKVGTKF